MNDDEIIKRKLLIDGDGIGDDRRINIALKQFIKWCITDDESRDETELLCEKIFLTLDQCELSMLKSLQMLEMYSQEMTNYDTLYKKIDNSIVEAQQKLIASKAELVNAKRIRRNKYEYDAIATIINQHDDRKETMKRLQKLQSEITDLQKTRDAMELKLERRRKQFQVLLGSAHQLQQILNEEETELSDSVIINDDNAMETD